MAALTEAGIYLWFRAGTTKDDKPDATVNQQPWTKMIQMYGGSGILWAAGVALLSLLGYLAKNTLSIGGSSLGSIVAFNSLIGFVGYALRFYLVPRVSTVVFSALSFFGIISAYLFDWVFTQEKQTLLQIAGALAIITANAVLVTKDTV